MDCATATLGSIGYIRKIPIYFVSWQEKIKGTCMPFCKEEFIGIYD
jgi:hypothetical protein